MGVVLYCVLLCSALLRSALLSSPLLCSPLLSSPLLSSPLLSSPLLCSALFYRVVLCCVVMCCVVLFGLLNCLVRCGVVWCGVLTSFREAIFLFYCVTLHCVFVLSFHSIHHLFVSFFIQGQIKPSKSLFTYETGQSPLSFVELDYRPMFIDNITWLNDDIRRKAVATCGNSTNCLYDAAVTSDMSYGASTKEVEEKNEKAKRESGESICLFFYLILHSFAY